MKKFLKVLTIFILILAASLFLAYLYFFSAKSNYQSIYLVPPNASLIIESEKPFSAWEDIINSKSWKKLKNSPAMAELNDDMMYLDSLFRDNKLLFKLMGERNVLVSMHEVEQGETDYLYIINLGRITKLRKPDWILSAFLGRDYRITNVRYKDKSIYEILDTEDGEIYYLAFILDKGVASTNYKLVEASIDEEAKKTIGRDINFQKVWEKVAGKGLVNLYINYAHFKKYLEGEAGKSSDLTADLDKDLLYSGFRLDISPGGQITFDGYTSVNEKKTSFFTAFLTAGKGELQSASIIPNRFASMVKIHFDDPLDFYNRTMAVLDEDEQSEFKSQQAKLEKKLKISIENDFLSWIDQEIILLQTEPSNLGRMNEFAIIIPAVNTEEPTEKLNYLAKQIHYKYFIKIKQSDYQGYAIRYISFPGLFKLLFGKLLDKIEKPYYTIIDQYVIFSNHPQTLKNIIDTYLSKNTLEKSPSYNTFRNKFSKHNTVYTYLDIPVLFSYVSEYVSKEKWKELQEDKPYFMCFPQGGIQLDEEDGLLHSKVIAAFSPQAQEYRQKKYDTRILQNAFHIIPESIINTYTLWYEPGIIIHDLDEKKIVVRYNNNKVKYKVDLKGGRLHGKYIENYPNGRIRVKGKYIDGNRDGEWILYDKNKLEIDRKQFRDNIELTE